MNSLDNATKLQGVGPIVNPTPNPVTPVQPKPTNPVVPFTSEASKSVNAENVQKTKDIFNNGVEKGSKSVGIGGGIKNTWNKAGTMGKVGMGAAAVGGTYLLGKGLGLWGNSKKE